MNKRRSLRAGMAAVTGLAMAAGSAWCQSNDFGLGMMTTGGGGVLTWNGAGSLQSSGSLTSGWADVLEATSPRTVPLSDARRFFRVISHWGTRSNLLQANSEMCVAELSGKIYVMGGYPASR